jgi:hypothetical protein
MKTEAPSHHFNVGWNTAPPHVKPSRGPVQVILISQFLKTVYPKNQRKNERKNGRTKYKNGMFKCSNFKLF